MEIHQQADLPRSADSNEAAAKKAVRAMPAEAGGQLRKLTTAPVAQTKRRNASCGAVFWSWAARSES